jgi:hypothetical protein
MAKWNYRRMRMKDGDDFVYGIYEVFYNEDMSVSGWAKEPASVMSDTPGFSEVMAMIGRCLEEPVLDYETGNEVK